MRYLLLLALLFFGINIYAQNTFPSSGNVGIGTTNPLGLLDIKGENDSHIIIGPDASHAHHILSYRDFVFNSNNGFIFRHNVTAGDVGNYADLVWIKSNGNVGIGTTSPDEKLTVYNGTLKVTDGTEYTTINDFGLASSRFTSYINNLLDNQGKIYFQTKVNGSNLTRLCIINNGNVGIGTTTPDYKLDVLGTIRANEVKVATGWSDFVFEPDYDLKSLDQVENFIKENGHLPDIPSAEEVEANGISLGEMDAKLLQKIEELTLYVIEQQNEIKGLKEEVKKLTNE